MEPFEPLLVEPGYRFAVVVAAVSAEFRVYVEKPAISRAMAGINVILGWDLIIGLAVG